MTSVLVTNDDGIASPGLCELAAIAVAHGCDVTIAAPRHQSSGASASILGTQEDGRIRFAPRTLDTVPSARAFAVDAAPALIALIAAHGAFGAPPDIVLSGINRGANVGRAILHSGTVGAALTAGLNGARALAVSLDVGLDPDEIWWSAARRPVRTLLDRLRDSAPGTVLNLNVPNAEHDLEIREATLATFGIVQTTMTDHAQSDEEHVRLTVADVPVDQDARSDAGLLAHGYATVTSIRSIAESGAPVLDAEPAR